MTFSYKYQIFLLIDALLLVSSIAGLGFGCGFEIQWLILLGVLGIAVTMLIGVVLLEATRRQMAVRKAREELYTIDHVTIVDPTS
jgi:hypothetical protein